MNFKKFISGVSALTIAASAFAGITAMAAVGDRTNLANVNFDNGTTGATTTLSTNADGRLVIGNGSAVVEVDDTKIGSTDQVEVQFKLAFGKLSGKNVYFNLKDVDNKEIASFTFTPYSGSLTNTLGVATDDMYYGFNTVLWDRNVQFDIVIDYFTGKITTNTSCLKSGAGKPATTATHVTNIPSGVGAFKSFTIGSNYNNADRYCQADDIVIDAIEGQQAQTAAYTVNYVCGETTVKSETNNGVVGAAPSINMADFKVNGAKYSCDSNDAGTNTILSDGSLVVNVSCTEIPAVTQATVNYVSGGNTVATEALAVSNSFAGESYTVPYRRYVAKDGVLYQSARTGNEFRKVVTLATPTVVNIDVTAVTVAEGETFVAVADGDGDSSNNADVRASYGAGKRGTLEIANVQPGIYKIVYNMYLRQAGNGPELFLDDTSLGLITTGTNWTTDVTFANIEVTTAGTLSIHNCDMMDTVVLYKTGDLAEASAVTADETFTDAEGNSAATYKFTVTSNDETVTSITVTADGATGETSQTIDTPVITNGIVNCAIIATYAGNTAPAASVFHVSIN